MASVDGFLYCGNKDCLSQLRVDAIEDTKEDNDDFVSPYTAGGFGRAFPGYAERWAE
jgi:hypothetical protein